LREGSGDTREAYQALLSSLLDFVDLDLGEAFDLEQMLAHGSVHGLLSPTSASTARGRFVEGRDLTATVWKLAAFSLMMSDCPMPAGGDKSLHRYRPIRGLAGNCTMLLQLIDVDDVALFLPR